MENKKALGVDIGNVIINNRLNDLKKLDEKGYAALPLVEGALEGLKTLNEYFKGEVYLLSKCTEWAQGQSLIWLKEHDFYNKTGIDPKNAYFVRERHEKDGVCRKLGITHFIDDRLEVLSHMVESTPNLILFQPDDVEVKEFEKFLPHVTIANSWAAVVDIVAK